MDTCYACELPACTVEHCPPESFFSDGQRDQLLTVASCAQHTKDNSKDVEYARNALTTLWGVNTSGLELFGGKVKRSFDRSPKLLNTTFSTMQTVFYEGQLTGVFTLDMARVKNVFEACARAIHFRETEEKHANWEIVMPGLMFAPGNPDPDKQIPANVCEILSKINFAWRLVANPLVFEYGVAAEEGFLYCFVFYQSFPVYARPLGRDRDPVRI